MIRFSTISENMRSSEIRRLMNLATDPSIISFAGGMPNNSLFPTEIIADLYEGLSLSEKQAAFQYCPTSGYPPLVEVVAEHLKTKGISLKNDTIIITTGGQQAINLVSKVLLDPGDSVLTEYPCFIGAIAAFKSCGAELIPNDIDENGLITEDIDRSIHENQGALKLIYINPCFHNPAGIIYSNERKHDLLKIVTGRNICLLEDDPYCELYFNEEDKQLTAPMKSICENEIPICYCGSFSKIFGPGMRLGWLCGPSEIVAKCELAKQSMDACSPSFTQLLAYAFFTQNKLKPYLQKLRPIYKRRAQTTISALEKQLPEKVKISNPKGGFYIWVTMPEKIDSSEVFHVCLNNGAAFVIGNAFDPKGTRNNSFRIAFSHTSEDRIEEGIKIICDAIKTVMARQ